jgi:hypothetical protein
MTSKGAKVKEKRIIALKYGTFFSIAAFFILLLLAFENHEIWAQAVEPLQKPQKEETKPSDKKAETLAARGPVKDTLPTQSYISIAEKNIFSPYRKDFPAPAGINKPIVRPQVILYGVTIAGDYQAASVSNPGRPLQKGERETFTVKLGEKIGDYKVASISSDRITLEVDADRFEVLLYDSRTPKKRIEVKTETKPATITSSAQAAAITPVPGTAAPSTPPVSAQVPKPSVPSAAATPSPPTTVTPAPPATQAPTAYPPGIRRGRTPYYPPSGTSETPGSPTQ